MKKRIPKSSPLHCSSPFFYLFPSSLRHWNAALVTAVSGKSQASAVAKGQNLGILEKCYAGSKEVGLCQGKVVTIWL